MPPQLVTNAVVDNYINDDDADADIIIDDDVTNTTNLVVTPSTTKEDARASLILVQ